LELQRSLEKIADLVEPSMRTYRTDEPSRLYDQTSGGVARRVEPSINRLDAPVGA
jgi:hypothetical protein